MQRGGDERLNTGPTRGARGWGGFMYGSQPGVQAMGLCVLGLGAVEGVQPGLSAVWVYGGGGCRIVCARTGVWAYEGGAG